MTGLADYAYKVKTKNEQIVEGVIDAPSESVAINILHGRGYVVLSLDQLNKGIFDLDLGQLLSRISTKDIVVFTRQLSTLIDADMPLSEGLRTLARQVENPNFKAIITDVAETVEEGSSLSDALSKYPKLFSPFYIKLVESGEVSGKMHESLLYLADYTERSQGINSKIRSALAYPAFILFSLILVAGIMVIYVLPNLLAIFKELGVQDLPLTTRILIWTTDFVNNNMAFLIIAFILATIIGVYYARTEEGRIWLDSVKIRFPSLGPVVRNLYLARIGESLATLIKSGIPILDTLQITADLVSNSIYREILLEAEDNVRGGGKISEVLGKYEEFPPLFTSMVAIGEKTGKLDFILNHISKFYKQESENSIQTISQIIEPALVLLLGVAVAIMVSSILLPIYNLVGV